MALNKIWKLCFIHAVDGEKTRIFLKNISIAERRSAIFLEYNILEYIGIYNYLHLVKGRMKTRAKGGVKLTNKQRLTLRVFRKLIC